VPSLGKEEEEGGGGGEEKWTVEVHSRLQERSFPGGEVPFLYTRPFYVL
jgi:hypothetical protein